MSGDAFSNEARAWAPERAQQWERSHLPEEKRQRRGALAWLCVVLLRVCLRFVCVVRCCEQRTCSQSSTIFFKSAGSQICQKSTLLFLMKKKPCTTVRASFFPPPRCRALSMLHRAARVKCVFGSLAIGLDLVHYPRALTVIKSKRESCIDSTLLLESQMVPTVFRCCDSRDRFPPKVCSFQSSPCCFRYSDQHPRAAMA